MNEIMQSNLFQFVTAIAVDFIALLLIVVLIYVVFILRDLKKISKDLEALVPRKDWKYVNNGLVLYGRYICNARPHDCSGHPLTKIWKEAATRWPRTK